MSFHQKKFRFLCTAFGILSILLSTWGECSEPPQNANVTIRGRVVDEDGNPVAGATILTSRFGLTSDIMADTNGAFQFEIDSKKLVFLSCHARTSDQTRLGDGWIRLKEGDAAIPELEITVEPGRIITGTVVDADNNPVTGAVVVVCDRGDLDLVSTDSEGYFKAVYENVFPPFLQVYAYKEGVGFDYLSRENISQQNDLKPQGYGYSNDLSVQLKLTPSTSVAIKVVNENGEPLPGVRVAPSEILEEGATPHYMTMLESYMNQFRAAEFCYAKTNEDGIATLSYLPEQLISRTRFSAYPSRESILHPDGRRFYYTPSYRWMKEAPEKQEPLVITLMRMVRVKGTVKLADGPPVPWINVNVSDLHPWQPDTPGHRPGFTDVNGEYDLFVPPNKAYHFSVAENMLGIAPDVRHFEVGNGDAEITLDFVLEKGIRLHGAVYDLDGKPLIDPDEDGQSGLNLYSEYNVTILKKEPMPDPDESPFLDGRERKQYRAGVFDGKYECLLPATKGEYMIRVRGWYGSVIRLTQEFRLNGDEKEFQLDLTATSNDDIRY